MWLRRTILKLGTLPYQTKPLHATEVSINSLVHELIYVYNNERTFEADISFKQTWNEPGLSYKSEDRDQWVNRIYI